MSRSTDFCAWTVRTILAAVLCAASALTGDKPVTWKPIEQALLRVGGDRGRPLLARPDLAALYQRRLGVYAGVASLTVSTDGRRPEAVVEDILVRTATLLLNLGRTVAQDTVVPHPGKADRMRVGIFLNYAGGFAETVVELADYERAGADIVFVPNHPVRDAIPVALAAIGPKNVTAAVELAESWMPIFY